MRDLTIECDGEGYSVVEHSEYEGTSVLAGQYKRSIVAIYGSLEEAVSDYPEAEVLDYPTRNCAVVPDIPSPDFDEADVGEL
jgi:hypothetical protein